MTEIVQRKINNLQVKAAPKWGGEDPRPPRGEALFERPFTNIFYCAKKHSGKTSNIFFTLRKIMGKNTKLIVFCSTVHKDPSWVFIIKYFKAKGIDVETHTSLKEEGHDLLDLQVRKLENEIDPEEDEEEEIPPKEILKQKGAGIMNTILLHNLPPEITGAGEKKERKSKYNERKYIWVLDDLSTELKSLSLVGLLKKSRHFGTVLMSSQYYLDIKPESRAQIDYFLIYGGQREDKLEAIYKDADLSIEYDEFIKLYNVATEDKYSFLYVDVRDVQFRKNFNTELEI